ncbi:DEAD/DEAH box helicase [Priestia megaterium]|uniref:DEAD/DEAH box helicase n=1 Tax=Priestia megaterium TaxID=1404 RepID=UPI00317BC5F5
MIEISYIEENHAVLITTNDNSYAWDEIRRVCKENSIEIEVSSDKSIQIPWWSFLTSIRAINLIIKKYKLSHSIDAGVRKYLLLSKETKKKYNEAKHSKPVSREFILKKLDEIGFERPLTNEQLRNVAKLYPLPGGATFSVPGAGKTTEALSLFFLKKSENTKLLIIAPKNAFPAWEEQIQECISNPPQITRLRGGERNIEALLSNDPSICLITYQQLPKVIDLVAKYFSRKEFFMFLDESHRIKRGHDGIIGKSILQIAHLPLNKLIMSGTPMPNAPVDLVPQFNFLYPEVRIDEESVLHEIQNIYVRTTKDELGLKEYKITMTRVEMGTVQRKLYNLLKSEELRQLEALRGPDKVKLRSMGKSVMTMLQVTSNPALLLKNNTISNELRDIIIEAESTKMEYVYKKVRKLTSEGKKVLVWSSFVENIEVLAERLKDLGADFIHGGVDSGLEDESDTREAKIKRFHEDSNAMVLIANPAAAGEGISLHKICHYAIYVDRNYNAAQFLQSIDRIHRLGLPPEIDTDIEIVYSPNTLDESVHRRLSMKIENMARVLNDQSLTIEPEYSDEEIGLDNFDLGDAEDFLKHLRNES